MKLKGDYFEQIRDALLDAFNPAGVQSMARTHLDIDLDDVAGRNATKPEMVEALISWAEERDRVGELVAGARRTNDTNKNLERVEEHLLSAGADAYILSDVTAPTVDDMTVDIYTDKKTGLEMIRIPAGNFIYGEDNRLEYLPEYWISKTPVTNALYFEFVRDTGDIPPMHWKGKSPKAEHANHPVVNVSWHDAKAYADWAGMDLPREKEWEKAARGTDGFIYPWGNQWIEGCCNTNETGIGTTSPIGHFSPQGDSPYGCVDMAGNVWEWTESWYDDKKEWRVVRGGSWGSYQVKSRAASRGNDRPSYRSSSYGFRLVVRRPPS